MIDNKAAILIPCYNEEFRLKCEILKTYIEEKAADFDFYFVNDGSTDKTSKIITDQIIFNSNNAYLIDLEKNIGKGNAIRRALFLIEKKYKFYGFIDADLQIPLDQIIRLQQVLNNTSSLIAITSRNVFDGLKKFQIRSIISVLLVMLANGILKFPPRIKDSQCGCKMFKAEVLEICFGKEFISGWLFDLEVLLRFRDAYPDARDRLVEVPVSILEKSKNSKVILSENLRLVTELIKINARYN